MIGVPSLENSLMRGSQLVQAITPHLSAHPALDHLPDGLRRSVKTSRLAGRHCNPPIFEKIAGATALADALVVQDRADQPVGYRPDQGSEEVHDRTFLRCQKPEVA